MEQDRHLLKRKLTSAESEYDARIVELQSDVAELTSKLVTKDSHIKQWEREKGSLVSELNAQNARLTSELKEAVTLEAQLQLEIQNLREQVSLLL